MEILLKNALVILRREESADINVYIRSALLVLSQGERHINDVVGCGALMRALRAPDNDYYKSFQDNPDFFNCIYYLRRKLDIEDDFEFEDEVDVKYEPKYHPVIQCKENKVEKTIEIVLKTGRKRPIMRTLTLADERISEEKPRFQAESHPPRSESKLVTAQWLRENECDCYNHSHRSCPLLRGDLYLENCNCPSQASDEYIYNCQFAIEASILALLRSQRMDRRVRNTVKGDIRRNPYVIMACYTRDEVFSDTPDSNSLFFQRLYRIRNLLRLNEDFGYMTLIPAYQAESDDGTAETLTPSPSGFQSFMEKLVNVKDKGLAFFDNIRETISKAVAKVFDFFTPAVKWITGVFDTILNKFVKKIVNYLVDNVFRSELVESLRRAAKSFAVIYTICVVCLLAISAARIVSDVIITTILDFITPPEERKILKKYQVIEYQAEGIEPTTAGLGIVLALVSALIGKLLGANGKSMKERMQFLIALMAGGSIAASVSSFAFGLLPYALQSALIFKFAPTAYQDAHRMQAWKDQADMLFKMSKVPQVLCSDEYYTRLNDLLKKGPATLERITQARNKSLYLGLYSKLLVISANLEQLRNSGGQRPEPFCVHFASIPGVGKTMMAHRFCRELFNVHDGQIYTRASGSEFWDGYCAQDVVIYDEFLVGDAQRQQSIAGEFLTLKSSANFVCPMASVDSPTVGIKGTTASPHGVVLINNDAYPSVNGINPGALNRRRNALIWVRPTTVDGRRPEITPELIKNDDWLEFGFLNPEVGRNGNDLGRTNIPWLKYGQMLERVKEMKKMHDDIGEAIKKTFGGTLQEKVDPAKMMEDVLRRSSDIPTDQKGVLETIGSFFQAEGKKKNKQEQPLTSVKMDKNRLYLVPDRSAGVSDDAALSFKQHHHYCQDCSLNFHRHKGGCPGVLECPKCTKKCPMYFTLETTPLQKTFTGIDPDIDEAAAEESDASFYSVDAVPSTAANRPPALLKCCAINDCNNPIEHGKSWVCSIHSLDEFIPFENTRSYWDKFHDKYGHHLAMIYPFYIKSYVDLWRSTTLDTIKAWAVKVVTVVGALLVINLVMKIFYPQAKDLSYTAESARPTKTTRNAQRTRNITRGIGSLKYAAEAATIPSIELEIGTSSLKGIGLCGKYVLTFAHALDPYVDRINSGSCQVVVIHKGQRYAGRIIPTTLGCNVEDDWVLFQVDSPKMPNFPDSVKCFLSESEIAELGGKQIDVTMQSVNSARYGPARLLDNEITYSSGGRTRSLDLHCAYRMPTEPGDCGSLVRIAAGTHVSKVIGIHVAGSLDKMRPTGVCNLISRESLREALNRSDDERIETDGLSLAGESLEAEEELGSLEDLPNLVAVDYVPFGERIHMSTKTKLEKNFIAPDLPYRSVKAPAILSKDDVRAKGDPVIMNMRDTLSTTHVEVEEGPVEDIYCTMYNRYNRMDFPAGRRRLTFEEACAGIPGVLSSVRVATSPGWPLVLTKVKKGKTDWVWFDEKGELCYEPVFKEMVEAFCEKMRTGEEPTHIWLGYMKDELVSEEKIANGRTRTIYASSLIATVAFRMAFGSILAAFNNNWHCTPMSIGANQYSKDMQVFYDYLAEIKGENYIAGDYKSFDKRCHPTFRKFAYKLLTDLAKTYPENPATDAEIEFFIKHETESPAQLGKFRFTTKSNHMSGCFYTTIVNCLVNEGYFRWCFRNLNPALIYDEHVRAKVLGDDHIAKASPTCNFNQVQIAEQMKKLGQEYTSDKKGEEIVPFRKFNEITYLGAHPRLVDGHWSGALKKTTLEETVLWTRDQNVTLRDTLQQLCELASQWDKDYYEGYIGNINAALRKQLEPEIELPSWSELRKIVARRTASTGLNFYGFY